jgi:hypothetical protein
MHLLSLTFTLALIILPGLALKNYPPCRERERGKERDQEEGQRARTPCIHARFLSWGMG